MCIKACIICQHLREDDKRNDYCGLTKVPLKYPATYENRDCGGFVKREEVECGNCMYHMHLKVRSLDGAICESDGITDGFITCMKKVKGTSYMYAHEYWDIPGTRKDDDVPRYFVQKHDYMLILRRKDDYCEDFRNTGCL